MSIIAAAVRHLLAAGVTGENLVAAIADNLDWLSFIALYAVEPRGEEFSLDSAWRLQDGIFFRIG